MIVDDAKIISLADKMLKAGGIIFWKEAAEILGQLEAQAAAKSLSSESAPSDATSVASSAPAAV